MESSNAKKAAVAAHSFYFALGLYLIQMHKRLCCFSIDFQINNFDANGYHSFEGCYPCELNCRVTEPKTKTFGQFASVVILG